MKSRASAKLLAEKSGEGESCGVAAVGSPDFARRIVLHPAPCPALTSRMLSPTIQDRERSIFKSSADLKSIPAAGLRQSHTCTNSVEKPGRPAGWCGQ